MLKYLKPNITWILMSNTIYVLTLIYPLSWYMF